MVDLCQPFLAFNGGTGKQLDAEWVKTVSPVAVLPAQSGPSVDIKTESPVCLSSTGSRPTIHWTVAVAHPSFNDICCFNSTSSLAGKEAKSREQSLPFTLGYWLSVCSDCGGDALLRLRFWGFVFSSLLSFALSKLGSQKVKLAFLFKCSVSAWPVTLSACHEDLHFPILFYFLSSCDQLWHFTVKLEHIPYKAEADVHEAEL